MTYYYYVIQITSIIDKCLKVSTEKYPTKGSVIASAIRTRFKARPPIHAGNPNTEL